MTGSRCSPGTVLLRPERIRRLAGADADEAFVDDLLNLATRIASDSVHGGVLLQQLEAAVEAMAGRLLQRAGGGLERAVHHVRELIQPAINQIQDVGDTFPADPDLGTLATYLLQELGVMAGDASGLAVDRLRPKVAAAIDVIEQDLGLTPTAVQDEIWALADDLAGRLESAPPEDDPGLREDRLETAAMIRRLARRLRGQFVFPQLDPDRISLALFDELRRLGVTSALDRVACVGTEVGTALTATTDLLRLVPFTGMGARSVGAGEAGTSGGSDTFLWYPTWLLGDTDTKYFRDSRRWYLDLLEVPVEALKPAADIWIKGSTGDVTRRSTQLFAGSTIDWSSIPGAEASDRHLVYTFKHISADAMESWARHTAYPADWLEMVLHIVRAVNQPAHYWGDVANAVIDLGHGVLKLAAREPLSFIIAPGVAGGFWGHMLATTPVIQATFWGSFQGGHSSAATSQRAAFWLVRFAADVLDTYTYYTLAGGIRDLLLTTFTLINYDGEKDTPSGTDNRPDNRTKIDGIVGPVVSALIGWLMVKALPREDYGKPGEGPSDRELKVWLEYMLLAGAGFGAIGAIAGTIVAECVAWAEDWALLGKTILTSMAKMVLLFWITYFNFAENDTGGGTYTPGETGDLFKFQGYPDNSASPYRLPWAKDTSIMCVQGNQGMWSHHFLTSPQVYAYDFALPQAAQILAARPGTVVDFFDFVPDDQNVSTSAPDKNQVIRWLLDGTQDTSAGTIPEGCNRSSDGFPATAPAAAVQHEAGNVTVGTHVYAVTFLAGAAESAAGPPTAPVNVTAGSQQVKLSAIPTGPSGTTGRNIYRSAAGTTTSMKLLTTINDNTNPTFTDNVADGSLGANLPTGFGLDRDNSQTQCDNWNFIMIRHDPDDTHDRGKGGTAVTTYGIYGHGRTNGVRSVFGAKPADPTAPSPIIGRRVQQGEPIMLAGSTGNSFHNHVHMEVRPGPPPPAPPASPPGPPRPVFRRHTAIGDTLPFVFREVSYLNPFADDGVPTSLKWYTSDNAKTGAP